MYARFGTLPGLSLAALLTLLLIEGMASGNLARHLGRAARFDAAAEDGGENRDRWTAGNSGSWFVERAPVLERFAVGVDRPRPVHLSVEGLDEITQVLAARTVESLSISLLEADSGKHAGLTLAQILSVVGSVDEVDLWWAGILELGEIGALRGSASAITQLHLRGQLDTGVGLMEVLSEWDQLRSLTVPDGSGRWGRPAVPETDGPLLDSLDFYWSDLPWAWARVLIRSSGAIRELTIDESQLGRAEDWFELMGWKGLRKLTLRVDLAEHMTPEVWTGSSLVELEVSGGAEGLAAMLRGCARAPALSCVRISTKDELEAGTVRELAECPRLDRLRVHARLGELEVAGLLASESLQGLHLERGYFRRREFLLSLGPKWRYRSHLRGAGAVFVRG